MTVYEELQAILIADAGVAALVADRVFPSYRPQRPGREVNDAPAVVWSVPEDEFVRDLRSESRLSGATFECACVSTTKAEASAVAEAVRQALSGLRGAIGSVDHCAVVHTGTSSSLEHPIDGSDAGIFVMTVTFSVLGRLPALPARD